MPSGFLERHDAAMMQLYSFEDRAEFSRRRSMWLYYLLRVFRQKLDLLLYLV